MTRHGSLLLLVVVVGLSAISTDAIQQRRRVSIAVAAASGGAAVAAPEPQMHDMTGDLDDFEALLELDLEVQERSPTPIRDHAPPQSVAEPDVGRTIHVSAMSDAEARWSEEPELAFDGPASDDDAMHEHRFQAKHNASHANETRPGKLPFNQTLAMIRCPADCSGNGLCDGDTCICFDSFTGNDCATKVCANNCSRHGVCNAGECTCDDGYAGTDCSIAGCKWNCHNNGLCRRQTCVCYDNYQGLYCEEMKGCPGNCSGNGDCIDQKCWCRDGFGGPGCADRLCPKACSGRGECDPKTGLCNCKAGFFGHDCGMVFCPNNCTNHGTCNITSGLCICDPGYHGENCGPENCFLKCSGHGTCAPGSGSRTASCNCFRGWAGEGCEQELCPELCNEGDKKGTCTAKGCVCDPIWTGRSCNTRRCPDDCSGPTQGICDSSTYVCSCINGFIGPSCAEKSCVADCNQRGICKNGTCKCGAWWTGVACEVPQCQKNCHGHGTCVLPTKDASDSLVPAASSTRAFCRCNEGWSGASCGKRECPKACAGNGVCQNGVCFCSAGFYGDDCTLLEAVELPKRNISADMARRMLCDRNCVHGRCIPVEKSHDLFVLNESNPLSVLAANSSYGYECFCEPQWAGPTCSQSLTNCPPICMDENGVCRKDCSADTPCPFFQGEMCGGKARGTCDVKSGACVCVPPFYGNECGTSACPNDCSGNGMCNTKEMKCLCYSGYTGADCGVKLED